MAVLASATATELLSSPLPFESANQSEKLAQRRRLKDLVKSRSREPQTPGVAAAGPKEDEASQTRLRPEFGRRFSRKGLVEIPPSTTFKRQAEEHRKNLTPIQPTIKERRDTSKVRRQRALSAAPEPPGHTRTERSVPENLRNAYPSIAERIDTDGFAKFTGAQDHETHDDEAPGFDLPRSPIADPEMLLQPETRPISHEQLADEVKGIYAGLVMKEAKCIDIDERHEGEAKDSKGSSDDTLDEEITEDSNQKWILNLSMHFRDKSPRKSFLYTDAESADQWRQVGPLDYEDPPIDSLEHDLSAKSARAYEALQVSRTSAERLRRTLSPMSSDPKKKKKFWADSVMQFLNRGRPHAPPVLATIAKGFDDQAVEEKNILTSVNPLLVDRQLPAGRDLPMIIKGRTILAQPDSGAENCNIISSSLASEFQLRIKTGKSDCRSFKMGNGKIVRAIGRVRVPCTFARDTETRIKCWFYVFKSLAVPLIMGAEFLKITRTLTEFKHRLVDRLPFTGNIPSVNLIGSPNRTKQRLSALLDGRVTYFNADSGCQVGDLMSPAYARKHGYKINRTEECRKRLIFADGTMAQTIGQVTATLSMQNGDNYLKVFDILPELISDVVLGEATLAQIDAFKLHSDAFVDVCDGDHHLELAILVSLGSVSQSLAYHFRALFARQKTRDQYQRECLPPWPRLVWLMNYISISSKATRR